MSAYLSVFIKLKISVTAEPIGFYSSGNIPTGPVVVLGKESPPPKKNSFSFCKI